MECAHIQERVIYKGTQADPAVPAFVYLQALDLLSTVIGLQLGASEASPFVGMLMHAGPVTGVLISKLLALGLGGACLYLGKRRLLRWANAWYAALVVWNLLVILTAVRKLSG